MTARVALVLVSHSAKLAEGVAELAAQMAPDVPVRAAGGGPDGGLGTDFTKIETALAKAGQGRGVLLLYDLGSARMTAELAVEALSDPDSALVVDAPLVEGAVAAAVAAQGGADLPAVASAAADAARRDNPETVAAQDNAGGEVTAELELTNDVGLHARPAALLARRIADLDAEVTIHLGDRSANARSVLALLGLTARQGDRITVTARGPQAPEALHRIKTLTTTNFTE